jgi:hypothetical protein
LAAAICNKKGILVFEEIGILFQANKRLNGDYEREQNAREQLARLGYQMFRQRVGQRLPASPIHPNSTS